MAVPRFTIAQGMILVAAVAALLTLGRSFLYFSLLLLWLVGNWGVAWLALNACRRRPRTVPLIYLVILAVGLGPTLMAVAFVGLHALMLFAVYLFFLAPVIVGVGVAWINHLQRAKTVGIAEQLFCLTCFAVSTSLATAVYAMALVASLFITPGDLNFR